MQIFLRVYFVNVGLADTLSHEAKAADSASREEGICLLYSKRKYLLC